MARQTIRVETERLDALMNLVGELVIARSRLDGIGQVIEREVGHCEWVDDLQRTAARIGRVTAGLQGSIMQVRMVPIRRVFDKFPRVVRDLARELGKEIEFLMDGEETELDRTVVERIGDPLTHLIRNAVDHGLEAPDERERLGKSRSGLVTLSAYTSGNHVVIEVTDDGMGLDPEALRRHAVAKGLLTEDEARDLSDVEARQLIFRAGFSTADAVTQVSGRGVGMDVVKSSVEGLRGLIEIESAPGRGATFSVKLPLTLAILDALLVNVGGEVMALPLGNVVETREVEPRLLPTVKGRRVLRLRDRILPLVHLAGRLGVPGADPAGGRYIVVSGIAERRFGMLVEGIVGKQEVVIKSLGGYLARMPGVSGATILGDGSCALILDPGEIMSRENGGVA